MGDDSNLLPPDDLPLVGDPSVPAVLPKPPATLDDVLAALQRIEAALVGIAISRVVVSNPGPMVATQARHK